MTTFSTLLVSTVAAVLLSAGTSLSLRAQEVVTGPTTTYTGTVLEYEPVRQTLIIRNDPAATPVTYNVTQATMFVDESGTPVRAETISSGVPVVVHSMGEGDRRIASRIVVKRAVQAPTPVVKRVAVAPEPAKTVEKTTTVTTTTGGGTITAYTPGMPTMVLRSDAAPDPVTYSVAKTTTFVDESGAPVEIERIGPGVPVSVQYVREGDRMVAERVMVVRERAPARKLSDDEKDAIEDLQDAKREADRKARNRDNDDDD